MTLCLPHFNPHRLFFFTRHSSLATISLAACHLPHEKRLRNHVDDIRANERGVQDPGLPLPSSSVLASSGRFTYTVIDR